MTKAEKIRKNIGLAFDLLREIMKNPSLGEKIPDGSTVVFLDKDQILSKKKLNGGKSKFVKVRRKFEVV